MYLLDAQGRRYDPVRYGDDASQEIKMTTGRVASGWFEFPRPQRPEETLVFVDDDIGMKLSFVIP